MIIYSGNMMSDNNNKSIYTWAHMNDSNNTSSNTNNHMLLSSSHPLRNSGL